MNKKLIRIIVSAVLLLGAVIVEKTTSLSVWQLLIVYLIPYLLIGYDIIGDAFENLFKGSVFNEDFLMVIATLGALFIGFLPGAATEFPEAVFVMLFFQVGELFEDIAEGRSRKSISELMDIRPDYANVLRGDTVSKVSPETVSIGEIIMIKPGEKIPLDGRVLEGTSNLDTIALTGESVPRKIDVEDTVISGCVNISGMLKVKVTKNFGESTASKIINLVENASKNKSKSEAFITKFARFYTPIVVFVAIALSILPPVFSSDFAGTFSVWLNRALTFLVVSCPCALVISVPLTFFGGIGGAGKNGILIKGGSYMETLAKIGIIVFDKTGTLTKGKFEVNAIHPNKINENQLLHLAAHVERFSTHPIAISLKNAYPNENDDCKIENVEELSGQGIRARVNGDIVCVGNTKMMDAVGAKWEPCEKNGTIIHVAVNGEYVGHIVISDTIKEDSKDAIAALRTEGVEKTVMLTGDRKEVGAAVAKELSLDEYHAELMPADKVNFLERLIKEKSPKTNLAFVGDGINDAPVLARADVGIAMGGLGSDAAIEAADVVLMDDKPSKIAKAISIARRTIEIAKQNVVFAIFVKVLVLILAGFGIATMWMAVFADVGVTILVILNAARTLKA
ncbi:MAG: heavy metal translocating P-type ATPase [Bacteroidales bacterium]|nr:heavy metal translocating P-type ATPase [Bacteroidales bacterium]MDD3911815.1 heavy metal translocating P-type ATPase [Bacteroidales bacterium]MDD4420953.1 heavy metal translocating P-type ATPase [Bacteroidales bacterium]